MIATVAGGVGGPRGSAGSGATQAKGEMTYKELQLQGDLRQAVENWLGSMAVGPWDHLLDLLTEVITRGGLSTQEAARMDLLLQRTQGEMIPDRCDTCHCPYPDMAHR